MGRGLVPVLVARRFVDDRASNESWGEEDRHKAPTSTPSRPLSLHDDGVLIPLFSRQTSVGEGTLASPARTGANKSWEAMGGRQRSNYQLSTLGGRVSNGGSVAWKSSA